MRSSEIRTSHAPRIPTASPTAVRAADLADLERDLRRACKADIDAALQQCAHEARCAEARERELEAKEWWTTAIVSLTTSAVVYAVIFWVHFVLIA